MQIASDDFTAEYTAELGDNPDYKDTVHDDAMARRMGYRAALVPGIIVLGYVADALATRLGMDWVVRGSMTGRSRRGVYDKDRLRIRFLASEAAEGDIRLAWSMSNDDDEEVALGEAGLPARRVAPPSLADYRPAPFVTPPPVVAAGQFSPGDRFGSLEVTITPEFLERVMTDFGQVWPEGRARELFPPGCIQKIVSRSINSSYRFATPPIFVATRAQHFAEAHVGQVLCTSGIIRTVYVRNGHHYYDADILVTERQDRPIALIQRSMIYGARPTPA